MVGLLNLLHELIFEPVCFSVLLESFNFLWCEVVELSFLEQPKESDGVVLLLIDTLHELKLLVVHHGGLMLLVLLVLLVIHLVHLAGLHLLLGIVLALQHLHL